MKTELIAQLKKTIITVKDFPKPGILFYDITPILLDPKLFDQVISVMAEVAKKSNADMIASPESRGFLFGVPLANKLKLPFVLVRKQNKLPRATFSASYDLEYGKNNVIEIHQDAIKPNSKVMIVDDLLATAGTVDAISRLVEQAKSEVVSYSFLIRLKDLGGIDKLDQTKPIDYILEY
ncbi:adenine phosphoribosyltransferase [Mycoplasmoides gallisepticum]|uniref:Adenine phosphoribosyltransferase n=1 Tax=Mycoplasmoides gallisepticum TaxID=2096 RepID=A0AB36DRX6_MYCGL|nr:adenine phosphoribosyltransferase [Mycoplasmoides gallisepticum]OBU78450.1 adenine phosphoribosyltransferase [Mycoplasmoides gallisepticum]OBU79372.1 adenine phosphoribosyltransferase [Mycoplasmoides gallisepticum]OBU80789.1 adenine phosphoribosyltransferase [Mycoplasmoides gallisepticum]OBU80973.1 adenine phosphoribosyltransferase [Mycoplasmoides gallisepticum]OBU81183.1 adenine phosphoribosyltransferase [Mycoplasmoides gallisepticum]